MTVRNLSYLLSPSSVALIGASGREGSLGSVVHGRLRSGGFRGRLDLVNPKWRSIDGAACARNIAALDEAPDLGVVVTPPRAVPTVIAELADAGARGAVVITAGLDASTKQRMLEASRRHCLRILGPNCVGLQVPGIGLDASFAHLAARPGNLALLSQSGAIVTAMVDWAEAREIGFSVVASMGEMADVDVGDLLDYLAQDPETKAILLYLEQVTDARKFVSAARAASRVKPVIAIKAGRSAEAARAAMSHTGALAGSDAVYDAALRRAGILRVDELEDLFDAAEALARLRPAPSNRLAIVTNGGGAGVLAADGLQGAGARLADLSEATISALDAVLPATWSKANPVDIIGDAPPERYEAALDAVLRDPGADGVLVMSCPTGLASSEASAAAVVGALDGARERNIRKPVLSTWLGEATVGGARQRLEKAGIPVFATPGKAVRAFGYLARHTELQRLLMRTPAALAVEHAPDLSATRRVVEGVLSTGRTLLTEPEAKSLLASWGIPTVETRVAASPEAAGTEAQDLLSACAHRPDVMGLALKILSRDISHKSDVGGVRLHLASAGEVIRAAEEMAARVGELRPDARIDGFAVQPCIQRKRAFELIAGVAVDRVFGPIVLFGAGGTSVEVVADKAVALPPLDSVVAGDMIAQTRISRLLEGYRDRPAADIAAVSSVLARLSELAIAVPEIHELDINPLLADEAGVVALDARVVVRSESRRPLAIRPYPAEWQRVARVGGLDLLLRPIRPEDEPLYGPFFEHLTSHDIRMRFFGALGQVNHSQIARFTQIDYARAMAFVALEAGSGELLGLSRLSAEPDGRRAEFALLVRSDRKGLGIGSALMRQLIDYAKAEGIGTLFGDVQEENDAMLSLCWKLGFEDGAHPDDRAVRRVSLRTGRAGERE